MKAYNGCSVFVSDTVDVIRGSSGQQWRVVKVKSDGNCLYGSLAMQLNRHDQTERSAATVRSEIVDFIRQHPNVASAFLLIFLNFYLSGTVERLLVRQKSQIKST